MKKKARAPVPTRSRILSSATKEFCAKGIAGARMDAIARRAGVSKQLILHHFKSKGKLYDEVHQTFRSSELVDYLSSAPEDLLADRFARRARNPDYQRFLTWEAAGVRNAPLFGEKERRKNVETRGRSISLLQEAGRLPAHMDSRMLHLAIVALTSYPLSFTEITRLIAGRKCTDRKFQAEWTLFLRQLGRLLSPKSGGSTRLKRTGRSMRSR
jgi:TetR/AcrR family transcriptional regulator